ncbi:LOW QUALITY PROTEIN: uncharacterized protein [Diadema setosum]|uniref:LOW QUALITY PROTEIN: uncharacterized protein n=1 Tax=Diadema setosum TaxID=31175 RepID=UPI003B3B5C94
MFPDSKIAEKFACRRTKTTAIAQTLGQETRVDILKKIRAARFSISTDGSCDRAAKEQLYPVVVRYFDEDCSKVISALLQIATTDERSTGKGIFNLLDKIFVENGLFWQNVICFSADNAAVMMGEKNGVRAFVKEKNNNIFVMGCLCHLLHLAAEKGADQLPFAPVDLLVPIYYYLEKSSKRQKEYRQFQVMGGVEQHTILKHVCTRWLSLEKALGRLIEQWEPLRCYFSQEAPPSSTSQKKVSDTPKATASALPRVASPASRVSSSAPKTTGSAKKTTCSAPKGPAPKGLAPKTMPCSATKTTSSATKTASSATKTTTSATKTTSSATKTTSSAPKATFSTPKTTSSVPKTSSASRKCSSSSQQPVPPSSTKSSATKKTSSGMLVSRTKTAPSRPAFASGDKAGKIIGRLNDYNKLYCLFLLKVIPTFTRFNLELQEDAPKIHLLHDKLQDFLKEMLLHFVKPTSIASSTTVASCNYKDVSNQREDKELIVGHDVTSFLASHKFSSSQTTEFFSSVRKFFTAVCDYILKKFPINNEVLKHASVADPRKRLVSKFESVSFFIDQFHMLEDKRDTIQLEFARYQVDDLSDVNISPLHRADDMWVEILKLKDRSTSQLKYVYLPKIMLAIISIPHSNAEDERIFSLVRKNSTEFHPSLATKTLSDLLTQKVMSLATNRSCYEMTFSDSLLGKCKGAAAAFNK